MVKPLVNLTPGLYGPGGPVTIPGESYGPTIPVYGITPVTPPSSSGGGGSSGGGQTSTPSSGGGGGGSTQPTTSAPTQDSGLTQEQLDTSKNILVPQQPITVAPIGGLPYGPTINISPDVIQQNAEPSFNRPSETATPDVLSTKVTYQQKGILSQKGTPQPPPTPYVGDPNAAKNRVDKRINSEITVNIQNQAGVVSQTDYDTRISNDFNAARIQKDSNGQYQITDPKSGDVLVQRGWTTVTNADGSISYVPPASYIQQANDAGTKYFNEQINSPGVQNSIQTIQSQEYGKENFVTVQNPDGTTSVVSRPQYEQQQQFQSERAGIVSRMKGEQGGVGSLQELARFWYSGFTPGNLLYTQTIGEILFGGKDKTQNIVDDYTKVIMDANALIKNIGPFGAFVKSYEPGGFGFTGTLAAVFQMGGPVLGAVGAAGKGGAIIAKTLPFVAMGGFSAVAGADIGYTFAQEKLGNARQGAGLTESLKVGTQIAMLYGLGKVAEGPRTEITMYGQGETVQGVKIQNYYDIMGLKVKTGKPIVGVRTGVEPSYEGYGGLQSDRGLISNPYVRGLQGKTVIKPGEGKPFISSITGEPIPKAYTGYELNFETYKGTPITQANAIYSFKGITPETTPKGAFIEPIPTKESIVPYVSKVPMNMPEMILPIQDIYDILDFKPSTETKPSTWIKGTKPGSTVIKQGERGIPSTKPRVYTGFELNFETYKGTPITTKEAITPFYKKEIVPVRQPGKLALPYVVSPVIQEMFPTLESGLPKYLEGMLFIKPKTRTIKQIVKPERQVKADDIFSSVSGGSQQVVLERPILETKTIQKPVVKTIQAKDYLESMLQQRVDTGSIFSSKQKLNLSWENEYVQRGLQSEQINKPVMKTERGTINVFSPVIVSERKQGVVSIEKAIQDFSFKQDSVKGNILIDKVIQDLSFRQETARITSPDVLTRQDVSQGIISISESGKISIQAKAQAKIQVPDITSITEKITVQVPVLGLSMDFLSGSKSGKQSMQSGEPAYDVQVKGRVYSHGKRIAKDNYHNITKHPLSYVDALAFGADVISKNEKASFRVVPAEGKPHKLIRDIPSFFEVAHQYNQKDKNTFTEKAEFRINSPGELMAITMKGIQANRRR